MSTERIGRTRIRVGRGAADERCRVRSVVTVSEPSAAAIRPVIVRHTHDRATVSLVPEGALLLAGDVIEIDVTVDPGVHLELIEPGGTVAFDMRGGTARWEVSVRLANDAALTWAGEPFIVSGGADVDRRTRVVVDRGARLALREVLVLGRFGEAPGTVRQTTTIVDQSCGPVLVEDLPLNADTLPGLLGGHRVVGSVLSMGAAMGLPTGQPEPDRYDLDHDGAVLWRRLGSQAHEADLSQAWAQARAQALAI